MKQTHQVLIYIIAILLVSFIITIIPSVTLAWDAFITAYNDKGYTVELTFGVVPDATDDFDPGIDIPAPPPGPDEPLRTVFQINDPNISELAKDFRNPLIFPIDWQLKIIATTNFTLSWNISNVPGDMSVALKNRTTGELLTDMRRNLSIDLDAAAYLLTITVCRFGDVSGNNEITPYDAALVLQATTGLIDLPNPKYPYLMLPVADITKDGTLSALDAAVILQYSVGTKAPPARR